MTTVGADWRTVMAIRRCLILGTGGEAGQTKRTGDEGAAISLALVARL